MGRLLSIVVLSRYKSLHFRGLYVTIAARTRTIPRWIFWRVHGEGGRKGSVGGFGGSRIRCTDEI